MKIKLSKGYLILYSLLIVLVFYFGFLLIAINNPPLVIKGISGGEGVSYTVPKELISGMEIENLGIFPVIIQDVILEDYNGININNVYTVKYNMSKVSSGKIIMGKLDFNEDIKKVDNGCILPNWLIPNRIYKNKDGYISYPKLYEYGIYYDVETTEKEFCWPRKVKIIYRYLGKKFIKELTMKH